MRIMTLMMLLFSVVLASDDNPPTINPEVLSNLLKYNNGDYRKKEAYPGTSLLHDIFKFKNQYPDQVVSAAIMAHENHSYYNNKPYRCWSVDFIDMLVKYSAYYSLENRLTVCNMIIDHDNIADRYSKVTQMLNCINYNEIVDLKVKAEYLYLAAVCKGKDSNVSVDEIYRMLFSANMAFVAVDDKPKTLSTKVEMLRRTINASDWHLRKEVIERDLNDAASLVGKVDEGEPAVASYFHSLGQYRGKIAIRNHDINGFLEAKDSLIKALSIKKKHIATANGIVSTLNMISEISLMMAIQYGHDVDRNCTDAYSYAIEAIRYNPDFTFDECDSLIKKLIVSMVKLNRTHEIVNLLEECKKIKDIRPNLLASIEMHLKLIKRD